MKVHSLESVLHDPQIHDSGLLEVRDHPSEGKYTAVNNPVRFSETPARVYKEPPLQGQDTDQLLSELGYSEEDIHGMRETGVFG
jgi:crotonobetainyl-CoA:carnitine CoA-transferase CaiB-like acyl-CoA transferase